MAWEPSPYIPVPEENHSYPLSRFLPVYNAAAVNDFLQRTVPPAAWMIDPLGSTPRIALNAARSGRRALVCTANPVQAFLLETLASAPARSEFIAAIADLAEARRGEERLEDHLLSFYQTVCSNCRKTIHADAYLWKRDDVRPYARLFHCPACGEEGERLLEPEDLALLDKINDPFTRSRAVSRLLVDETVPREAVQELVSHYRPRPLYVLFSLFSRLDTLPLQPRRRQLLTALLLSLCDRANDLWPWPQDGRPDRPRQLSTPAQFIEINLWAALEGSIDEWCDEASPVPFSHWPELPPPQGGICLAHSRHAALLPLPPELKPEAAVAVFPRLNPAFWSLCALWAGWLFGQSAARPLKNNLVQRLYDWASHSRSIASALVSLNDGNSPSLPLFCLAPEGTPGFFGSALAALNAARFELQRVSLDEEDRTLQIDARCIPPTQPVAPPPPADALLSDAIRQVFSSRGEPLGFIWPSTACLLALASEQHLPSNPRLLSMDVLPGIQDKVAAMFKRPNFLLRLASTSKDLETGLWWPAGEAPATTTLSDRVEEKTAALLQDGAHRTVFQILHALNRDFPGLQTPSRRFVLACLESYALENPDAPGNWQLNPVETVKARQQDLTEMRSHLARLAQRLGFTLREHGSMLLWLNARGEAVWQFTLSTSACLSSFLLAANAGQTGQQIFIFPGRRSRLVHEKLRANPLLEKLLHPHIHLVKYRTLRHLSARQELTPEQWSILLDSDPPSLEETNQLSFFI